MLTAKQGMASQHHPLRLSVHFSHVYPLPPNTARLITASIAHSAVVVSHAIAPIPCALRLNELGKQALDRLGILQQPCGNLAGLLARVDVVLIG